MKKEKESQSSSTSSNGSAESCDEREIYCPRLGHLLNFGYCRKPGAQEPCFKILDCWWQTFDVSAHLKAILPEEVFAKLAGERPPPNRIHTILDIIEEVKKKGND